MAAVTLLEDGTEVALPMPESWSDSDDDAEQDSKCMAGVTLLEDGTEIALPLPDSWSDSDDDVAEQESKVHSAVASSGLSVIASIPEHNHSRRQLADAGSTAGSALAALAELQPLPEHACQQLDCNQISTEDFAQQFVAGDGCPVVIRGVADAEGWPAAEHWRSQSRFLDRHGKLSAQVTEMSALHGLGKPYRVELSFAEYAEYAASNQADWPFYVWERNFDGDRHRLLEDFQSPQVFKDDLYDIAPEIREFLPLSCHLFVLVGGRRTGSNVHTDPKWSSAWNTLLCGHKRWVLFPRDVAAEDIGALAGDAYKDGGPQAYWWLDHYPRLRAEGRRLGMVDILQGPGDTVFIPGGWWHATLNLPSPGEDVTIACTRNVFPPAALPYVFPRMRAADPAFARTFLESLRRLRPEVLPRWLPEEANATTACRCAFVGTSDSWKLERRPASSLSLAACRRDYIRGGKPLIIEGLAPHLTTSETCGLSREWLSTNFGEKCVAVYRNFKSDRGRDEEDRSDLLRLRDVLSLLRQGGLESEGLYVYDLSLPLQLPGLLDYVRLPRYFSHCFLQQTMRTHCFSRSWPTLFIGAKGSHSKLHIDQWHGHFWMYLVSGRKRWVIFHPEDAHMLNPQTPGGRLHPIFPDFADLEAGVSDAPDFKKARRIDVDLEEGEVLFVPGGAPHFVVNLEDSVAIAGNFIDESNYEAAMADIHAMASKEAMAGPLSGVYTALDEIDFEHDRGLHEELLDPRFLAVRPKDFFGGGAAAWGAIPPGDDFES